MNYSWMLRFGLGVLLLSLIMACGEEQAVVEPAFRVGVALGAGGLGDRSFNDSAYKGLQRARDELGVQFRTSDMINTEPEAVLRDLSTQDFDLVIVLGQEYNTVLKTVAQAYPQQRYAFIDGVVDAPNVTNVVFRELEGDFLAGALTALMTTSDTVGFIGGADIEVVRRIEYGWRQGVEYIDPSLTIQTQYLAGKDDFSGFARTDLGRVKAEVLFENGADVIYVVAGRAGLGSIEVASEMDKHVITTSDDQRWIDPSVLTSRIKRVDEAVWTIIAALHAGTLESGTLTLDFHSAGIAIAPLDNPRIPEDVRQHMLRLEQELRDGTLKLAPYTP